MKEEHPIPWFRHIKCGWRHRLGNVVSALIHVIENTIIVISFGYIYPNIVWKFMMYRLFDSKLFNDPKKPEENGVHEEN
jgi:hypothetical protein